MGFRGVAAITPEVATWSFATPITTGVKDRRYYVRRRSYVDTSTLSAGTSPSGGAFTANAKVNGSSNLFASNLSVADGGSVGTGTSVVVLNPGDYLVPDIVAVNGADEATMQIPLAPAR